MTVNLLTIANGTTGNAGAYSSDGITWTSSNLPSKNHYSCASFSGNTFVVINNDTSISGHANVYASTNGLTWSANTLSLFGCSSLGWNGNVFAGVGYYGNVVVSSNGISWNTYSFPINSGGIASDVNGNFLSVDTLGNSCYSTNNGVTWTTATTVPGSWSGNPVKVVYGNGVFAVFLPSNYVATTSNLGITWTVVGVSGSYSSLAFSNGVFLLSGSLNATSTDGVNWTVHSGTSIGVLGSSKGNFLTINSSYATQYSSDGVNWANFSNNPFSTGTPAIILGDPPVYYKINRTATSSSIGSRVAAKVKSVNTLAQSLSYGSFSKILTRSVNTLAQSNSITFNTIGVLYNLTSQAIAGSVGIVGTPIFNRVKSFVASATTTSTLISFLSLKRWTNVWSSTAVTQPITGIATFLAGSNFNSHVYYNAGYGWQQYGGALVNCLAWNGSVAVGLSSTGAVYSTNLLDWPSASLPVNRFWTSVTAGGSTFVAVAANTNKCAVSSTGTSWTEYTLPSTDNWNSVAWNGTVFCAVNDSGTCATSTNGTSWTLHSMPDSQSYNSICYGLSKFYAIGAGGVAASSSDGGVTWTRIYLPSSANWTNICAGQTGAGTNSIFAIAKNTPYALQSTDGVTFQLQVAQPSFQWLSIFGTTNRFITFQSDLTSRYQTVEFHTFGTGWNAAPLPTSPANCFIALEQNGIATSFDGINFAPSGKGVAPDTYYVHCIAKSKSTAIKG